MAESHEVQQDQLTYRRGFHAALVGLGVQVLLAVSVALIMLWSESAAVGAATWHYFGGLAIWIVLALLYQQHVQERVETLEAEQLTRTDAGAAAIFNEHADDLELAKRRLERLYKYGLPATSAISATYLLVVGLWYVMKRGQGTIEHLAEAPIIRGGADPLVLVFLMAAVAFVAFLIARYVAGMTNVKQWQLLRGGASYLMGNCVVAVLVVIGAVVLVAGGGAFFMTALTLVIPIIMILISAEMWLTLLLGVYRPRKPGEVPRPAFDSRVLGILTAPESIGKIVGETLNYQFGFELSKSWFYQLLGKAITPLIVFGMVVLLGMSSLVIVGPAEQVVITRFGAKTAIKGPGPHVKWPWPIGEAVRYEVGKIHRISVGPTRTVEDLDVAILWTNAHTEGLEQYMITLPSRLGVTDTGDERAGVSLVSLEVVVQYRIADLAKYIEQADDPENVLAAQADRVLNAYVATHDIDTLVATGRNDAEVALREAINPFAESLGLEVVFAGITSIHPPSANDVAAAFHEQIGALQEKEGKIEEAQTKAITILGAVAGSEESALALEQAILEVEALRASVGDDPKSQQNVLLKELEIEQLLAQANGKAATIVFDARAFQWQQALAERGNAERFSAELASYRRSPKYYRTTMYLATLADAVGGARKTVLLTDRVNDSVLRFDLKDSQSGLDFLSSE